MLREVRSARQTGKPSWRRGLYPSEALLSFIPMLPQALPPSWEKRVALAGTSALGVESPQFLVPANVSQAVLGARWFPGQTSPVPSYGKLCRTLRASTSGEGISWIWKTVSTAKSWVLEVRGILEASVELSRQDSEHKGCPLCLPAFFWVFLLQGPHSWGSAAQFFKSAASLSRKQISFCLQLSVTATPLQVKERGGGWLWGSPESRAW